MGLFGRGMQHWDLRASDEDRERVVELLREHCAAGRLRLDEFTSRLDEVYAARTYRELAWTTRELPRLEPRPQRSELGVGRHVAANGAVLALWLAVSDPSGAAAAGAGLIDFPWPVVTAAGSAAVIGLRAWLRRVQGHRLGGRRRRYQVSAKDQWQPGMRPPRWLPAPPRRSLPPAGSAPSPSSWPYSAHHANGRPHQVPPQQRPPRPVG